MSRRQTNWAGYKDLALANGVAYSHWYWRVLERGWDPTEAATTPVIRAASRPPTQQRPVHDLATRLLNQPADSHPQIMVEVAMQLLGVTGSVLADLSGSSKASVSQVMNRGLRLDRAVGFARAMGVDPSLIVDLTLGQTNPPTVAALLRWLADQVETIEQPPVEPGGPQCEAAHESQRRA